MAGNTVADIRRLVGFPVPHWQALCAPMMDSMPDSSLEKVRHTLMLRQGIYLPPGAAAEDIYRLRDVWTYAVLVASLIQSGMSMASVPAAGIQWLEHDEACMRNIRMAMDEPPTGLIHEIMQRAVNYSEPKGKGSPKGKGLKGHQPLPSDEREREEQRERETVKVQTELLPGEPANPIETPDALPAGEEKSSGQMFLNWLREGIKGRSIPFNKPGSRVHVIEDGVLIASPGTFQDYDSDQWESVQKSLLSMGIHRTGGSNNLVTVKVKNKPDIQLKGILIKDVSVLFEDTPAAPNPALELYQEEN